MRFALLHDYNDGGNPVFVNPDAVSHIMRATEGSGSQVVLVASRWQMRIRVTEAPEEAARLLDECPPWDPHDVQPTKMPSHGSLRSCLAQEAETPGRIKVKRATWRAVAEALWSILDDISTAGDLAKGDDKAFRRMADKLCEERSRYLQSRDGQTLVSVIPIKE